MLDLRFYLWFKCEERFYKDAFYIQADAGIDADMLAWMLICDGSLHPKQFTLWENLFKYQDSSTLWVFA